MFDEQLRQAPKRGSAQSLKHKVNRRASLNVMNQDKLVTAGMEDLRKRLPALIAGRKEVESCLRRWQPDVTNVGNEKKMAFARAAVNNFFDNDLLYTTRRILSNAVGSFGLCINCSLDSTRQVAFAARGQTISIAFFPRMGIVTYGSEAAATKAPLTIVPAGHKERLIAFFREHDPTKVETVDRTLQLFKGNERDMWNLLRDKYPRAFKTGGSSKVHPDEEEGNSPMDMMGIRIDLDDLGGEVCLLDWGEIDKQGPPSCSTESLGLAREQIMGGKATVTLCQEAFHKFGDLASRAVHVSHRSMPARACSAFAFPPNCVRRLRGRLTLPLAAGPLPPAPCRRADRGGRACAEPAPHRQVRPRGRRHQRHPPGVLQDPAGLGQRRVPQPRHGVVLRP